ncbi:MULTISPECIES: hypothetical protein [Enterobacterales]|uniref:hypothetical protein n=1 Tax=Enterobacterales TaxID=91347 RepID=UPI002EDAB3EC
MLTKKEKAWFFLLCGEQPKINELIFLVFCSVANDKTALVRGLSSVSKGLLAPFEIHAGWRFADPAWTLTNP